MKFTDTELLDILEEYVTRVNSATGIYLSYGVLKGVDFTSNTLREAIYSMLEHYKDAHATYYLRNKRKGEGCGN